MSSQNFSNPASEDPLDPEQQLPAELQEVAAAFASLAPRTDEMNVELLLYRAGQLSPVRAPRPRLVVASVVSALLAAAASVALTIYLLPPSPAVQRIHLVRVPVAVDRDGASGLVVQPSERSPLNFSVTSFVSLRNRMLDLLDNGSGNGAAATTDVPLRELENPPATPPVYRQQLRNLLERQAHLVPQDVRGGSYL